MPAKYILVSLPRRIFDSSSNDRETALGSLKSTISLDHASSIAPFPVPEFKIGTLDALVQQADDLAKLDTACSGAVAKVTESMRAILDGDESKLAQNQLVNDKPVEKYMRTFTWNKVRYRADKSIGELVASLQSDLATIDNDVRSKFNQYNSIKTNLAALQRRQTGSLATKSLAPIVDPSLLVQDSEYLESHLIVVPSSSNKEFLKSYETLSPMVVPRSCVQVAQDDEFTLFAVTTFKKHSADFLHKCRENKWTPRHYKYVEGGKEEEQKELDRLTREEKKVWGEALHMGRTGWSECVMIWIHVLTLRVFVETVLRYGLPLEYLCVLIQTSSKQAKKIKANLDSTFSYLGGGAFGRDKRGRVTKDDAAFHSDMAAAGLGSGEGSEYTAYVYYEFEFA